MLMLWAASDWPIHDIGENYLYSAHMLQHMMLSYFLPPLAILAIAVARSTHAPNLRYLACVGALDPEITRLRLSSEDLAYLDGRAGEVTIPDLFDHARRGRVDLMFFGAAEVDGRGDTNLTAAGTLDRPKVKFPGVAGAATLRRWVQRPVLVVGKQSRRNLVDRVQVASTTDPGRRTRLITDLGYEPHQRDNWYRLLN